MAVVNGALESLPVDGVITAHVQVMITAFQHIIFNITSSINIFVIALGVGGLHYSNFCGG